ncbi:iron complex transport system permease protein [Sediminihabitans luteus]|uniref:Iron complex transport system permease protein n=1 Tax=Sediminihabitans luteus TaxID=1138585 RepID=A0A2M9CEB2_9CELL|nr:iron chelate uptake ABC transporter family permease subunit [Sediminihabitans luteus]PJJ70264.1 iron complex transport system permease protein [Sediminihabitans luteus]GII97735.1 ABC transporter permease [Sediminihabitans luteus]
MEPIVHDSPPTTLPAPPRPRAPGLQSPGARTAALVTALVVLVVCVVASLAIGSRAVPVGTVWAALTGGDVPAADHAAVVGLRLPRTVLGLAVGASLAVAGAVIQAVTRNPLADPGILGVTSGSAFLVAVAVGFLGVTSPTGYVWFAFAGALLATVAVYLVGSAGRGTPGPAQLTLAGVALGAVLSGLVSAIRLTDPERFAAIQAWESGSFQNRGWDVIVPVLPFVVVGLLLALALTGPLNALSLGDDLAHALGSSVGRTRVLAVVVVTLLAGGATAMAGPIVFVGLMVPHVARWVVGPDQRWIVALSMVLGPVLVLVADVAARVVARPGEIPVGVVTAFVGAPVLVALVRRRKVTGL